MSPGDNQGVLGIPRGQSGCPWYPQEIIRASLVSSGDDQGVPGIPRGQSGHPPLGSRCSQPSPGVSHSWICCQQGSALPLSRVCPQGTVTGHPWDTQRRGVDVGRTFHPNRDRAVGLRSDQSRAACSLCPSGHGCSVTVTAGSCCRALGGSDPACLLICNRLRVPAVVSVSQHSAALSSANSIHQLLDRPGE